MKKTFIKLAFIALLTPFTHLAQAGFPDDLSDVVFVEADFVKGWPIGATMSLSFSGGNILMPYTAANTWPSVQPRSLNGALVNANAWGVVKISGTWYAGTWEYLRPGQTGKKVSAFGGCCHFKPPIGNFRLDPSQIYGVFISGVVRDQSGGINVQQRTNYMIFNGALQVLGSEGSGPAASDVIVPLPAIDLLLEDDPA